MKVKKGEKPHPSHKIRISDSPFYDRVCEYCNVNDMEGYGYGPLANPCKKSKSKKYGK